MFLLLIDIDMASFKAFSLLGLYATSSLAGVIGLGKRQVEENFKLYTYASGYDDDTIGGFPVFYADGMYSQPLINFVVL